MSYKHGGEHLWGRLDGVGPVAEGVGLGATVNTADKNDPYYGAPLELIGLTKRAELQGAWAEIPEQAEPSLH